MTRDCIETDVVPEFHKVKHAQHVQRMIECKRQEIKVPLRHSLSPLEIAGAFPAGHHRLKLVLLDHRFSKRLAQRDT